MTQTAEWSRNQKIALASVVIAVVVPFSIYLLDNLFRGSSHEIVNNQFNKIDENSMAKNVVFAQNVSSVTMVVNENANIPYTRKFEYQDNGPIGRATWNEMYNVLIILPNNTMAFLPVLRRGEKYILAYTNEDCSEIKITDAHKLPDGYQGMVCTVRNVGCSGTVQDDLNPNLVNEDAMMARLGALGVSNVEKMGKNSAFQTDYFVTRRAIDEPGSCRR